LPIILARTNTIHPLTAPFFGSCSEFNTIIFIFFLFSGDSFQESDKYAIQARIDSVWGEDMSLFRLLFIALPKCPLRSRLKIATALQQWVGARRWREEEGTGNGGFSAAGLNAGLHGN
jgi:hypothetical protein